MKKHTINLIAKSIVETLFEIVTDSTVCWSSLLESIHFKRIVAFIEKNEKIQLVLPAFPAKSPNLKKTSGLLPDMAEVLGLQNLNNICKKINKIYSPGAEVVICSDGRVFSDLVQVDDVDVNAYTLEISNIIKKFDLNHLRTFNLEDVYETDFNAMRDILVENYACPLEKIQQEVKNDENMRLLFNGIHRFIFEDQLVLDQQNSRNFIRKNSKKIAYQVIQRSNAWSRLVEEHYPNAVRLSIHPHKLESDKLGVQLVPCKDRWGTPWHNVAVFDGTSYFLSKHEDVIASGGVKIAKNGYVLFILAQEQVA